MFVADHGRGGISTHALREEGDDRAQVNHWNDQLFLPTPSARRATINPKIPTRHDAISTHALREEGDILSCLTNPTSHGFLPTPSARRATANVP